MVFCCGSLIAIRPSAATLVTYRSALINVPCSSAPTQRRPSSRSPDCCHQCIDNMDTSLRSFFIQLEVSGSPAQQEILHLQSLLDRECLQNSRYVSSSLAYRFSSFSPRGEPRLANNFAPELGRTAHHLPNGGNAEFDMLYNSTEVSSPPADYSPDLIKRLALYLSSPLNQVETLGSSIYRIHQLRALIAALALLHHLNVEELHAEPYNELRVNIANRFNDIVDGRRPSQATLTERTRYVEAMFLIRLAAQYFSLFKRRGPLAEALFVPVLGLVLTGASVVRALFYS